MRYRKKFFLNTKTCKKHLILCLQENKYIYEISQSIFEESVKVD